VTEVSGNLNPQSRTQKTCWRCGRPFLCGPETAQAKCWCDALPSIELEEGKDCLCQVCLGSAAQQKAKSPERVLVEGEDYYREGTFIVFTAEYHLRRGYCCSSGCRHCPYKGR